MSTDVRSELMPNAFDAPNDGYVVRVAMRQQSAMEVGQRRKWSFGAGSCSNLDSAWIEAASCRRSIAMHGEVSQAFDCDAVTRTLAALFLEDERGERNNAIVLD